MANKRRYRHYSKDKAGQFASKESFNRSQAQGGDNVQGENIEYPDEDTITSVDQLFGAAEAWDYDFDPEDFVEYEYHGTGDTGKSKGK